MDGIIIINKPQWYTSFDVVAKARKQLNTKKVGHTGTLDPMATGVLVVCVGKATSLVNSLICEDKIYKTTLKLGVQTDTGDLAGIIRSVDVPSTQKENSSDEQASPLGKNLSDLSKLKFEQNIKYVDSLNLSFTFSQKEIESILKSFIGKQKQKPSIYSAIKVNGKKLYEYAREGKEVDIPEREIEIFDIYDVLFNGKDEITYTVHCSKGTYIRSLNEDIANKLGTIGTTYKLERVKTGDFSIDEAVNIDNISDEKIISIEKLFDNRIILQKDEEKKFLNGILIDKDFEDGIYNIYIDNNYIGLGKINNKKLKRYIVIS